MMNPPLTERRERTLDNNHMVSSDDIANFSGGISSRQMKNKFASSTRLIKKSTTAGIHTQDSNGSIEYEGAVPKFGSTVRAILMTINIVHFAIVRFRK
jgi:hypothetical protein